MGGVPPLGYEVRERRLVVNPTEANTVRYIYERYLELGCVEAAQQGTRRARNRIEGQDLEERYQVRRVPLLARSLV